MGEASGESGVCDQKHFQLRSIRFLYQTYYCQAAGRSLCPGIRNVRANVEFSSCGMLRVFIYVINTIVEALERSLNHFLSNENYYQYHNTITHKHRMKQPGGAPHWLLRAKTRRFRSPEPSRLLTALRVPYPLIFPSLINVIGVDGFDELLHCLTAIVSNMWQGLAVLLSFATVMGLA